MKKLFKILLGMSMVCALAACSSGDTGSDTLTGTYSYDVTGYDWGCGVSSAIITLDYVVDEVAAEDFVVTETKQTTDWTDETYPVIETTVDRTVTAAYLVDEDGAETDDASAYVKLELYCSPSDGSPLLFTMSTQYNTYSDPYYLTITLSDDAALTSAGTDVTSFTVDTEATGYTTDADAFETASYEASDGTTYEYASYAVEDSDTLVVWLHGMGEGGTEDTDPYVTTLANKVTALIGDEFQDTIGTASVLVPQCPTYWMDSDGEQGNFNGGSIVSDGTSYYVESLHELIEAYAEEVGAEKIVIAGCSNGGFMTMLMAINYGDEYDAYVPICEALPDEYITDDQIEALAKLNMYFIYSEADTTVDPTVHEIPTLERLEEAGAENIHVSTSEAVIDTSGEYTDEDGNAYTYSGHWSWIYFDNNEADCDDCDTTVFDWIAEQVQ